MQQILESLFQLTPTLTPKLKSAIDNISDYLKIRKESEFYIN